MGGNNMSLELLERYSVKNYLKQIDVAIEGITPILMGNPIGNLGKKSTVQGAGRETAEEEAARSCYWSSDGKTLIVPAINMKNSIMYACGSYKIGKQGVKSLFAASVEITPEELSLGTKKYEVDTRRAVIKSGSTRASILRSRAKIMPWSLKFTLNYDSRYMTDNFMEGQFIQIIVDAGIKSGICDFRPSCPSKTGWFGKYEIKEYKLRKH
jgi:hypothetical protein